MRVLPSSAFDASSSGKHPGSTPSISRTNQSAIRLAGRAAAKGLQSKVEVASSLPSLVVGDPVRLRAALENLIDNAVKFTESGAVAMKVVPTRAGKGRVGVSFAVSDSGI